MINERPFLLLLCIVLLWGCGIEKNDPNSMVVSAHPAATKIGVEILKKGGNAIDASVAVEFALAVCYHSAGNIGGGGFMVYRNSSDSVFALDYRETAPKQATKDMFLDEKGNIISRLSLDGGLSVGVPGSVDGIFEKHRRFGSLPMEALIQPAIDLAKNGFRITQKQAKRFNANREKFDQINPDNNYLREKKKWKKGDVLIQEDLANTLGLIKSKGRDGFYKGSVAQSIIKSVVSSGGRITLEDLKEYRSVWRQPIEIDFKGYRIVSMPPPSSGGVVLGQILGMLEDADFSLIKRNSVEYVHLLSEAEKRCYADRNTYLGDPDFWENPVDDLLDRSYLKRRFQDFDPNIACKSSTINPGKLKVESEETTHFSIVDKDGNAVSVTTTLNSSYGSKLFVDGCGFLLNNEMDDFSSKPGEPNQYGLIGGVANSIAPQKRMLSSMTPSIVCKDGELIQVVGSPGGSTIITSTLQNILNVIVYNLSMQESVNSPRFHHQWMPEQIFVEEQMWDSLVLDSLQRMGHKIKERSPIGRVDAIRVFQDGSVQGGADPRGDDCKMGIFVE